MQYGHGAAHIELHSPWSSQGHGALHSQGGMGALPCLFTNVSLDTMRAHSLLAGTTTWSEFAAAWREPGEARWPGGRSSVGELPRIAIGETKKQARVGEPHG